jgi:hypothetical protein
MRYKKSKKGAMILMVLFEVIAVFTIITMIIIVAKDLASSDRVVRNLIVEDMNLMVNSLISVPGEMQVKYPLSDIRNITKYAFSISNTAVSVRDTEKEGILVTTRTINVPMGYTVIGAVQNVDFFCLNKKNKEIILSVECT